MTTTSLLMLCDGEIYMKNSEGNYNIKWFEFVKKKTKSYYFKNIMESKLFGLIYHEFLDLVQFPNGTYNALL